MYSAAHRAQAQARGAGRRAQWVKQRAWVAGRAQQGGGSLGGDSAQLARGESCGRPAGDGFANCVSGGAAELLGQFQRQFKWRALPVLPLTPLQL